MSPATATATATAYGTPHATHFPVPHGASGPRIARLAARLTAASGPAEHAALTAGFWEDVAREGTPLVEAVDGEPDHRAVTFLWRGHRATRQVLLLAEGLTDPSRLDASLLTRLPGTEIWYLTYRLRADHRGSYRMVADISPGPPPGTEGRHRTRLRGLTAHAAPDPLNRLPLPGRRRSPAGSVFELPHAPPQPWRDPRTGTPRGTVEHPRRPGAALGDRRTVRVYLPPPGTTNGPLDTLVLPDGGMWFGALGIEHTLDALIADRMIPPLAVLAPDPADEAAPWRDWAEPADWTGFLADTLLPWAAQRWPLTADPRRTVVAGQGPGATAALHACLRRPDRFGTALAQSPGWPAETAPPTVETAPSTPENLPEALLPRPDRRSSRPTARGVRVHLEAGLHEGPSAARLVDALHHALDERGVTVSRTDFNGAHDYACWRGGLADALVALLGR
ncbi:enterochelin esterase domain-containing protein [Streptomyces angustmyceticus]|uniref:enterochelin esterase domain-containing protein n=1 Tax=Streptomyces angustmyceticus TaxID=285578 RepID=UPI0021B05EDF|nr:enterochelin esterase domain-containing protein [Streptomyces angustmyceticus]